MRKIHLAFILCTALVSGCSHPMPYNNSSYIQENLLVPCSTETPIPKNGTGGEVFKTLESWQTIYNECSQGKILLIKAIRKDG